MLISAVVARALSLNEASPEGRANRLRELIVEKILEATKEGRMETEIGRMETEVDMVYNRTPNQAIDKIVKEFEEAGYKVELFGHGFLIALRIYW